VGSLGRATTDLVTVVIVVNVGANVHLVHRNVVGLDRVRKHDARRVRDRPARCGNSGRRRAHALPLGGQHRPFNNLELH